MMNRISQLNWYQKIGPDQLKWWSEEIDNAVYQRLYATMYQGGIVNSVDPKIDTSTWNIEYNSGTVTIGAGTAITENGLYLQLTESVDVTLLTYDIPSTYLVVGEGTVVSEEDRLNEFGEVQPVYYEIGTTVGLVEATEVWNDVTIWSDERKKNTAVLGILRIGLIDGTEASTIDYTSDDYNNRQWFSIADYVHRNEKGTGNDNVPHNIALTDLSDGDITIYNQLRANGFILAKDVSIGSIAGTKCEALFVPADFTTDVSGDITGVANAKYVHATDFIERLIHASDTSDNPVCFIHLERSNILYLMPSDLIPASGINVWYTKVGSLAPIINFSNHLVEFDVSLDGEVVVGKGKASVVEEKFAFDTLSVGPMPKKWDIWWDGDKTISQTEPISCPTLLENIGTTEQLIDESNQSLSNKISIGLANAGGSPVNPSLSIKVLLTGKDEDGNSVSETLHFSFATYNPSTTSASTTMVHDTATGTSYSGTPGNYIETATTWSEITSWQLTDRQNDGVQSIVTLFKEHAWDGHLDVATVYFNGTIIERVKDNRPIFRQLANSSPTIKNIAQQYEQNLVINGDFTDCNVYWSDDYSRWKYMDAKNTTNPQKNPWYSGIHPVIEHDGYFMTQAFNLEGTTFNSKSFMEIYGENPITQMRGVTASSPTVWTSWYSVALGNIVPLNAITGAGLIKVQFRIQATKLEGYAIVGLET